jgi:hypothetical protein
MYQQLNKDGFELVIDESTGECFASQAAIARMCGVESTQIRRFLGGDTYSPKTALVNTSGGDKEAKLYDESAILDAILRYNPPLARACMGAGVRVYLHRMAGYQVKIEVPGLEADRQQLERQLLPSPTMKQIAECARTLKAAGISKAFIERVTVQNIKKHYPQLLPESPKPEEMASLPTAKALLTPTQIAVSLSWWSKTNEKAADPRRVNKLLAELGYQEQIGGRWSATEKALSANLCDRKPVDTNSRTQKDQLLWSADILAVLREHSEAA